MGTTQQRLPTQTPRPTQAAPAPIRPVGGVSNELMQERLRARLAAASAPPTASLAGAVRAEADAVSTPARATGEAVQSGLGGISQVRSAITGYRDATSSGSEAVATGLAGASSTAGSVSALQRLGNTDRDVGNVAGHAGNALGAAGGLVQARRGMQALDAARPMTDGSARDLQATQAARTTLDGASAATSGAAGIATRLATTANLGNRPTDGISWGADPARVTRAAGIASGLERAGGAVTALRGGVDLYEGYQQSRAVGPRDETNNAQQLRETAGRQQMVGGALRLGQGVATVAGAAPVASVIGAARTGFEIGAEGDRLSGERGTVRDDQGAPLTTSQWAGDDAARIRRERGALAGAGALVGNTVVAGTVAVGEYGRTRADRAANTAAHHMGLEGPSARELAQRAAAEEAARRSATAAGARTPAPAPAPTSAPDPLLAPARAADVRAGQVDAAGRRTTFPTFTPLGSQAPTFEERLRRSVVGG